MEGENSWSQKLLDACSTLTMAPREWGAIFQVRGLWRVELGMWNHYLFRFLPFDIFLATRQSERPFSDFRFGETPYSTARKIFSWAEIGPHDRLLDLGCGRGKVVFTASCLGIPAIGIDLLAFYIKSARRIAAGLDPNCRPQFFQEDFLQAELEGVSAIFVGGVALAEETREDLLLLASTCEPGCKWITVGWDPNAGQQQVLLSGNDSLGLTYLRQQEFLFSWGREIVRLYRIDQPAQPVSPQPEDMEDYRPKQNLAGQHQE